MTNRDSANRVVTRWHATGDYAYPAAEAEEGEFVAYEDYANVERALAESREECDRWRAEAMEVANGAALTIEKAEARAEQLAALLREAKPLIGWTGSYPELHKRIDAALSLEPEA